MPTVALHIDPAPPAPSRREPDTFSDKGDAFLAFIEDPLVPQLNALSTQLNAQADAAVASALSAASNASVSAQSRADAIAAAAAALTSADTASASAGTATTKAAEALASANAAAAIQGIPSVAGNQLKALRVNAAGTGIEWVQDGNALTFTPVQQGTGVLQVASNVVKMGRAQGPNTLLKATIDTTDLGYVITTAATPMAAISFAKPVSATSFTGAHIGDASALTGLTPAQISGALGYTPFDKAFFNPGALVEVGRYFDFHAVNSTNDFDARMECSPPTGGNASSDIKFSSARLHCTGNISATAFFGNGAGLTGLSSGQITSALGYTPVNSTANSATMNGLTQVFSVNTDFSTAAQPTLRITTTAPFVSAGNSCHMEFVREGQFGIKVGLDSSNNFAIGGYSQGAFQYRAYVDPSGNFVATGNVTAFSDIRFKSDMRRMENVTARLLSIPKGGIEYLDNQTGQKQYGVGAQYLAGLFPHAVLTNENGFMSVAYGNLALAALIEVTREFQEKFNAQQALIEAQQKQIDKIMSIINQGEN